ncbi:unnamed protein product [Angiostrongylus costaricensis]|uniref:Uncharacterized protein n=1 Tax=Angiostrongylus costaricensis TaxID=334426 RepID=A0A0R3PUD2_ANGCS|nr:unnamed protein product [Angiostrongylus costaricensis]
MVIPRNGLPPHRSWEVFQGVGLRCTAGRFVPPVSTNGGGDASRVGADRDREESPEPPSSTESNAAYTFPPTQDLQDAFHFTPNTSPQLVMSANSAKAFTIVPLTVHSKTLPPIMNSEQGTSRGERASSASALEGRIGPVRMVNQGQVVNLVQVRTRAMSTTGIRAATLRKTTERPPSQPVPIEGTNGATDVV